MGVFYMSFNFATCICLFYILLLFFHFKIPTVLHMRVCIINKLMLTKLLTLAGRLNQNLIVILCHTQNRHIFVCLYNSNNKNRYETYIAPFCAIPQAVQLVQYAVCPTWRMSDIYFANSSEAACAVVVAATVQI